jgi:hypothetical protein
VNFMVKSPENRAQPSALEKKPLPDRRAEAAKKLGEQAVKGSRR